MQHVRGNWITFQRYMLRYVGSFDAVAMLSFVFRVAQSCRDVLICTLLVLPCQHVISQAAVLLGLPVPA